MAFKLSDLKLPKFEKKKSPEQIAKEREQAQKLQAENAKLVPELTNKNGEFYRQFHKMMETRSYHPGRQPEMVDNAILQRLIAGQKNGQTAKQIYGTPTELAEFVATAPTPEELAPPTFVDYLLDSGLFITALFSMLAGIMMLFGNQTATNGGAMFGPVALLVNFLCGGGAMAVLTRYQPNMNAPKGKRGIPKYLAMSFIAVLAWLFILSGVVALVPPQFNPMLPMLAYFIIAAVAFLLRTFYRQYKGMEAR
ncbi:MAG: DUF1129 family protein [Aerococcus sp.]|nr:DUF1129 family protein [Aerococcus sp.]